MRVGMKRWGLAPLLALEAIFTSKGARAEPSDASAITTEDASPPPEHGPRFGAPGQWAVFGGTDVSFSSYAYDHSSAAGSSVTVSPGLSYFFVRNVSLGLAFDVSSSDAQGYGADGSLVETRETSVAGGVRLGVNLPLGELFSWFPQLTVGYEWIRRQERLVSGESLSVSGPYPTPSTLETGPYLSAYAPLLFHPVRHFFLGFGPEAFRELGAVSGGPTNFGGQRLSIGVGFVAGGDWGGRSAAEEHAPGAPPQTPYRGPRFGDAGEIVLTNALVANVSSEGYAGTNSSVVGVSVGGTVDYFLIPHGSIGLLAEESYSNVTGIDAASHATTRTVSNTTSFGPRVGADVPMGRWLSTYFVGSFEFGFRNYDETENGAENEEKESISAVKLYVPVLVHPAPHFFVGLGPSIYYEFAHSVSFPNVPLAASIQNRELDLAIGSTVGGWF
jgi:hypothetical protein